MLDLFDMSNLFLLVTHHALSEKKKEKEHPSWVQSVLEKS